MTVISLGYIKEFVHQDTCNIIHLTDGSQIHERKIICHILIINENYS